VQGCSEVRHVQLDAPLLGMCGARASAEVTQVLLSAALFGFEWLRGQASRREGCCNGAALLIVYVASQRWQLTWTPSTC
jgi:hypothetical protein